MPSAGKGSSKKDKKAAKKEASKKEVSKKDAKSTQEEAKKSSEANADGDSGGAKRITRFVEFDNDYKFC